MFSDLVLACPYPPHLAQVLSCVRRAKPGWPPFCTLMSNPLGAGPCWVWLRAEERAQPHRIPALMLLELQFSSWKYNTSKPSLNVGLLMAIMFSSPPAGMCRYQASRLFIQSRMSRSTYYGYTQLHTCCTTLRICVKPIQTFPASQQSLQNQLTQQNSKPRGGIA